MTTIFVDLEPRPGASGSAGRRTCYVRCFADLGRGDVPSVGGKNASLGEMTRSLSAEGVRVPEGFATTAEAYRASGVASRPRSG